MSKKMSLVLASMMSLGLVACVTPQPVAKAPVPDCVFSGTDVAAPDWVCNPVEGVEVSAIGIAEPTAAGEAFMKQMAATDARVQLAQQMKVQVQNMIKQYVETTGTAKDETVDKVMNSTTKQITNETLVGTKIFKTRVGPNGRMYVLLGVDHAAVQKMTETAVKTSMNNERALWQKFQAGKSQDELAKAIADQKAEALAPAQPK